MLPQLRDQVCLLRQFLLPSSRIPSRELEFSQLACIPGLNGVGNEPPSVWVALQGCRECTASGTIVLAHSESSPVVLLGIYGASGALFDLKREVKGRGNSSEEVPGQSHLVENQLGLSECCIISIKDTLMTWRRVPNSATRRLTPSRPAPGVLPSFSPRNLTAQQKDNHEQHQCPMRPVACPHGCGASLESREVPIHVKAEGGSCSRRPQRCR